MSTQRDNYSLNFLSFCPRDLTLLTEIYIYVSHTGDVNFPILLPKGSNLADKEPGSAKGISLLADICHTQMTYTYRFTQIYDQLM
jgi:hypothetical protein